MKHNWTIGAAAGLVVLGVAAFGAKADEAVKYKVVGEAIPLSLTGKPGDPANGKKVVVNRKKGHCIACHVMPIPEEPFHGDVGTDLGGVADRLTAGEMRLRIVDPKVLTPDTIMPGFHRSKGLNRVLKKWRGKTILSAQEVEDVVAYLLTLKGGSK